MRALKTVLLAALSALLVLSALFLQANVAMNATIFSGSFFGGQVDRAVKDKDMEQFASGIADSADAFMPLSAAQRKALADGKASAELKRQVADFKAILKKAVDGKWLASEAPRLAKGLFSFLTGSGSGLPAVGIAPLKDALVEYYAGQAFAGGGEGVKEFEAFIGEVELTSGGFIKNGKANGAAVDRLMQMGQLLSMDMKKDTAGDICVKIGNRKKDGSTTKELLDYMVKAVARDMVDSAGVKDELDLNVLVKEAYHNRDNPISGFPAMFGGLRRDVLLLSIVFFALLLCAIAVVAFDSKSILRWIGIPLIAAGILGLAPVVGVGLLNASLGTAVAGLQSGAKFDLSFLRNLVSSYAGGVTLFMLAQCAVFIALGFGLNAAAKRRGERHAGHPRGAQPLRIGPTARFIRAGAAIVLLAAIPLSAMIIGRSVMNRVNSYDRIVKASARADVDFGGAMMKALGISGTK